MSHIVIIIDRAPPTGSEAEATMETPPVSARVTWTPPHDMSDAEVAQAVKRLYRQIRNLGTDNS